MNNGKKSSPSKSAGEHKDAELIHDLYDFMCQENVSDLSVEEEDSRIIISRYRKEKFSPSVRQLPHGETEISGISSGNRTSNNQSELGIRISSPLIGTFYRSSSPGAEPYVKEGENVDTGQVLCIVEAMKVMNEIRAEKNCRIKKILAENGKPVIADQPLFEIELL